MARRRSTRIGFVDLNVDNFHANTFISAIHRDLKKRGYRVAACTAHKRRVGQAWAKKQGITWCESAEELSREVDCFMILAPSNPEVHLPLCREVLPFGKPTYVDKTFASDLRTAKRIFAMADKHKTPIQTSSALRYTNVQAFVAEAGRRNVQHMVTYGSGGSFEEYAIHPVDMAISCPGPNAVSLMRRGGARQPQLLVNFTGGSTAVVNVCLKTATPYAGCVTTRKETRLMPVNRPPLFIDTAAAILDFFGKGKPQVPRAETLMIRRILDAAQKPAALKRFVKLT